MKPLKDIVVIDLTRVLAGPYATMILRNLGARVIKVERPGVGDATRKQLVDVPGADSLYFTMLNHNKRSIELNSKNETGKQVLTRLIEECDVMVENFAPGALDRMGFHHAYGLGLQIIIPQYQGGDLIGHSRQQFVTACGCQTPILGDQVEQDAQCAT